MSQSLSPKCTPLKQAYDECFNHWFEKYLDPPSSLSDEERTDFSQRQAQEFGDQCGKIWESYGSCVQQAVKEKGLDTLLQRAREDNPLLDPSPPESK